MRSMTGFGKACLSKYDVNIDIEIKSVNAKYLDLRYYTPRELSYFEPVIRKTLSRVLRRGSIEVRLNYIDHREPKLQLNELKLRKYHQLVRTAAESLQIEADFSLEALLKEPGMIESSLKPEEDLELNETLCETLEAALSKLDESLISEGSEIKAVLQVSADRIENAILKVHALVEPYRKELFDSLTIRINEILSAYSIDNTEQRLIQELAIYIDKYDIHEELTRLESHIKTFRQNLASNDDTGKTLQFIMQEMQREANTLGSKFSTKTSFEFILLIKEEIEKCREIILNVA